MGTASATIVVASDHGGFALKGAVKRHLGARGFQVLDVGTHDEGSCDYPVFARAAAEAVATGKAWRGVVIDGAGIGSAMVANKVAGVRAGMAFDPKTAVNAAEHNGAHVLTLGAGYLDEGAALAIVDAFLGTACTVDRHLRRVAMIDALDGLRPVTDLPPAAEPSAAPSKGVAMTPAANDYDALVATITRVLSNNPALLASVAPASHATCPTCNPAWGDSVTRQPEIIRRINEAGRGMRVSARLGVKDVPRDLAPLIDHTLLKPDATYADIDQLCDEARKYGFASVCVNPTYVKRAADRLRGSSPKVCTVIGFPLGATPKEVKALEARKALRDGATELDMVIAIGALKSGDHKTVYEDIRLLAEVAREGRAILKVIIETALLSDEEKVAACVLSRKAGAHFVKTSTGFAKGGATEADVALMAQAVEHKLEVKASGGVRSAADAKRMVEAGATRIGASVGVKIAQEERGERPATGASAAGGGY